MATSYITNITITTYAHETQPPSTCPESVPSSTLRSAGCQSCPCIDRELRRRRQDSPFTAVQRQRPYAKYLILNAMFHPQNATHVGDFPFVRKAHVPSSCFLQPCYHNHLSIAFPTLSFRRLFHANRNRSRWVTQCDVNCASSRRRCRLEIPHFYCELSHRFAIIVDSTVVSTSHPKKETPPKRNTTAQTRDDT